MTSSVLGKLDFMYPNTPNNGIYVWMGTSAGKTSETAPNAEMECDAYLAVEPAPGVTVTSGLVRVLVAEMSGVTISTVEVSVSESPPAVATMTLSATPSVEPAVKVTSM